METHGDERVQTTTSQADGPYKSGSSRLNLELGFESPVGYKKTIYFESDEFGTVLVVEYVTAQK